MTAALRTAGHDVIEVADVTPQADDEQVAALAKARAAILITEDRDFGRLVYVMNQGLHGVIYVRWPVGARRHLGPALVDLVHRLGDGLRGAFVVLTPGRARVRRMEYASRQPRAI